MPMALVKTDTPTEQQIAQLTGGLRSYNIQFVEPEMFRPFAVFDTDEQGVIQAGISGKQQGEWLSIEFLWVGEALRGTGLGGRLVAAVEEIAVERGSRYLLVDTFSFQALGFYQKQGFVLQMSLDNYPHTGQQRHYLTRSLVG
ncbi:hypothetical protein DT73_15975 [Mangrovibacter sp. MFB070]|nr:hypothetical protein DT73_15975 [Mangrovibacter sp. MFB070]